MPGATSPAPSAWSSRERLAGAIVIGYLAVQLTLPVVLLFYPRPQRFGWQMFTNAPVIPQLVLHRTGGRRDTVDINRYFAVRRPELLRSDLDLLPAHVCRVTPDAAAVELQIRRDSLPRFHPCS